MTTDKATARSHTEAAETEVNRIGEELSLARDRLAALESSRGAVARARGGVEELASVIASCREQVEILSAGLVEAQDELNAVRAEEEHRQLEAAAEAARAEHAAALAEAYTALGTTQRMIAGLGALIEEHEGAIEGFNRRAKAKDRDDLAISIDCLRREAAVTLGGPNEGATLPEVTRNGETDEAWRKRIVDTLERRAGLAPRSHLERDEPGAGLAKRAWLSRLPDELDADHHARLLRSVAQHLNLSPFLGMSSSVTASPEEGDEEFSRRLWEDVARKLGLRREGESDEAYKLRRLRAAGKQQDRIQASDPIRDAGYDAIAAIQQHALGLDAVSRRRMFPDRVSARCLRGADLRREVEYGRRLVPWIKNFRG